MTHAVPTNENDPHTTLSDETVLKWLKTVENGAECVPINRKTSGPCGLPKVLTQLSTQYIDCGCCGKQICGVNLGDHIKLRKHHNHAGSSRTKYKSAKFLYGGDLMKAGLPENIDRQVHRQESQPRRLGVNSYRNSQWQ